MLRTISTAIKNSSNEYFCLFMSDLSDNIEDLKTYYETIKKSDLDAVFGSRFIKGSDVKNYPKFKYFIKKTYFLGNLKR